MIGQGAPGDVLAQFYGLFFLATGAGILLSRAAYGRLIADLRAHAMLTYLAGLGTFATGLVTVSLQTSWPGGLTAVTVIGWLALIEGLLLMTVPGPFFGAVARLPLRGAALTAAVVAVLLLGLWLLMAGLGVLPQG